MRDEAQVFPETDLDHPSLSWFLALVGRMPAGVIRVLYDLPLHEYSGYALDVLVPGLDIESFLREAYQRLRLNRNRFYRFLTEGWDNALHRQLSA